MKTLHLLFAGTAILLTTLACSKDESEKQKKNEAFDPEVLVLEYTITERNTTIQLPIDGTVNCIINWGDGSKTETINDKWPAHSYSSRKTYTVAINGTVSALNSSLGYDGKTIDGVECLTAVKQWGKTGLTSMEWAFYQCTNLISIPEDNGGGFSNVTSFNGTFAWCASLTSIPDNLFYNCPMVECFSGVFDGCSSLISIPEKLFSKCPLAVDFEYVFYSCTSLITIPEDLFFYCPAATNFGYAFDRCTSLESVPVSLFDNNRSAALFYCTFYDCSSVNGESPYTEINVDGMPVKVHLYERANYPDYFTAPTAYAWCFHSSTFSDIDSIPYEWHM